MAAQPDIDIVSVVVKVPGHHGAVMAALEAGKHVYCEWPLGLDAAEAEEMADLARATGVVSAVGLQGRQDPTLAYIKDLIGAGWLGDVLTVDVQTLAGAGPPGAKRPAAVPGATLWSVAGGHTIDSVTHVGGPLGRISATLATPAHAASPDHVVISGALARGGLLSYRLAALPQQVSGWRMEVRGSEGTIIAFSRQLPQITPIELVGSQGDEPLVEMPLPDRYRVASAAVPEGPARNVGLAYARMAESIRRGSPSPADFDDAVALASAARDHRAVRARGPIRRTRLVPHWSTIVERLLDDVDNVTACSTTVPMDQWPLITRGPRCCQEAAAPPRRVRRWPEPCRRELVVTRTKV